MLNSRRHILLFLAFYVFAALCAVGYGMRVKPPEAHAGDSPQYLQEAYHLHAHGTFSPSPASGPVPPGIGREPGYATLLAILMSVDPTFGQFTPDCLTKPGACADTLFRVPQWTNAALIGLAGMTLFSAVWLLTGSAVAAGVAGGYLLLNVEMHKNWYYIASDHLALWLLTLVMLATVWAMRGGSWKRWATVGLALAGLSFVKAIFLLFVGLAVTAALVAAIFLRNSRKRILVSAAAVLLTYGAATGGWIVRNGVQTGHFAFTDSRSGIALSTREVLNHMTPQQYGASFVYWTRGFGDGLADRLFPKEVVAPFDFGYPGGFYDVGQLGYGRRLTDLMNQEGLSEREAMKKLDRSIVEAILTHPVSYALTTLPVFYRGIWVDEFIVIGLPLFAVLLVRAIRRRDWTLVLLLGIGAFNLLFYALLSLNVTRYQMTAVPSLAIATGVMIAGGVARLPKRRRSDTPLQAEKTA